MSGEIVVSTLGTGGAQIILAVCVVALAGVCWTLSVALIRSYHDRIAETRETLKQQASDARLVAEAMLKMTSAVDLALAALKGGR